MTEKDVEIIAREQKYGGYAKIEQFTLRHSLFAGGWSRPITRELIERGHAVAVLPYDPVRDEVILIRQFRMGAWGAGDPPWMVETVAGIIEDGEDVEGILHDSNIFGGKWLAAFPFHVMVPFACYRVSPSLTFFHVCVSPTSFTQQSAEPRIST